MQRGLVCAGQRWVGIANRAASPFERAFVVHTNVVERDDLREPGATRFDVFALSLRVDERELGPRVP